MSGAVQGRGKPLAPGFPEELAGPCAACPCSDESCREASGPGVLARAGVCDCTYTRL